MSPALPHATSASPEGSTATSGRRWSPVVWLATTSYAFVVAAV
jgi:hypothetical protein